MMIKCKIKRNVKNFRIFKLLIKVEVEEEMFEIYLLE